MMLPVSVPERRHVMAGNRVVMFHAGKKQYDFQAISWKIAPETCLKNA
jgi:hypothetical protein